MNSSKLRVSTINLDTVNSVIGISKIAGPFVLGAVIAWLLARRFYKGRVDAREKRIKNHKKQLALVKEQHNVAASEAAQVKATLRMLKEEMRKLRISQADWSEISALIGAAETQLSDLQKANIVLSSTLTRPPDENR